MGKVLGLHQLRRVRRALHRQGKSVVFTNGTFDIIHRGHVEYLMKARRLGDVLIVGLNTDASIRRIKGKGRPINSNADRASVVAALVPVDYVCFFREDTPRRLIAQLGPDVLVKGADWTIDAIVGKDIVEARGGRVATIRLTPGRSTTNVIQRILATYQPRHKSRSQSGSGR
jgi:D-beta-D-heptose 7-phosphate kinase/D-beta-D-heptose 1-phosphate adenosyltransferase